jgi:hypothetical protein
MNSYVQLVTTALLALILVAAIPGCDRDNCRDDRGRGPGWKDHEHGDPLQGYGPKNPSGKDLRHGS